MAWHWSSAWQLAGAVCSFPSSSADESVTKGCARKRTSITKSTYSEVAACSSSHPQRALPSTPHVFARGYSSKHCRSLTLSRRAAGNGGGEDVAEASDRNVASSSSSESSSNGSLDPSGAAASLQEEDFYLANADTLRSLPLVAGATGGILVLFNRIISGLPAVADAGSSQARADVICLVLSASLVLTGLTWLSLKPKPPKTVSLEGVACFRLHPNLPPAAAQELRWLSSTLQQTMRCSSLLIVYRNRLVLQAGVMKPPEDSATASADVAVEALLTGSICATSLKYGRPNYLANLALFPGRFELFGFLPENTQAVIVEPLGDGDGVMILGSETVRGFAPVDQVWVSTIAQKIDSSLQECTFLSSAKASTSA